MLSCLIYSSSYYITGAISGVIELDVTMEEDLEHLMYSRSSTACPFRAPEDLNIELIQLHLSRIGNLLEGIKSFASNLAYIVSWKNPVELPAKNRGFRCRFFNRCF